MTISPVADITIEVNMPSAGLVRLTAVNEKELGFLQWAAEQADGASWDARSVCVPIESADEIVQTCVGSASDIRNEEEITLLYMRP